MRKIVMAHLDASISYKLYRVIYGIAPAELMLTFPHFSSIFEIYFNWFKLKVCAFMPLILLANKIIDWLTDWLLLLRYSLSSRPTSLFVARLAVARLVCRPDDRTPKRDRPRSNFRVQQTRRDTALSARCNLLVTYFGALASTALQ